MFDRAKYKKFARMQLKGRWGIPVVMTIITAVILGILYSILVQNSGDLEEIDIFSYSMESTKLGPYYTFSIAFSLISYILTFAQFHVYLKMSKSPEPVHFSDFMEGFSFWLRSIITGIVQGFWVFLWSLLFVIPGIVKAFAYSQTRYLVLEFPKLSVSKAIRISKEITKGHKADIFVTYLSFIPWYLLCILTAGIGFLWLSPYISMTLTNVYHALLTEAIETNRIKPEDLEG